MQRNRLFLQTLLLVVVLRRCVECIANSRANVSAGIRGDVIIGGLFSIHRSDFGLECKQWANPLNIQRVEAMLFAIDMINKDPSILPNITLGAEIRDDCYSGTVALEESLHFILNAFSQNENICSTKDKTRSPRVVGVVGTGSSGTSLLVASLLRLFRLPQVSYGATSPDLSNRDDYGYFTRTVPSDDWQAMALIDIINYLNWTAVYLISSPGNYGQRIQEAFLRAANNNSLCIVDKMELHVKNKDSWEQLDTFLQKMNKTTTVRGVVLLTEQFHSRDIFKRINVTDIRHDRFVWLGTDTWGTESTFWRGLETIADGAIAIALHAGKDEVTKNFLQYLDGLKQGNNHRNPWFDHFYENTHSTTQDDTGNHTDRERLDHLHDDKLPYVIDSVYALAHSLDKMLRNTCSSANLSECLLQPIGNHDLLDYLLRTNFSGASGMVSFDRYGNGVPRYDIVTYINGTYGEPIAVWNQGQSLSLNLTEYYRRKKSDMVLESTCTAVCEIGEARIILPGSPSCCWKCKKCSENQYVDSKLQCQSCPKDKRTNQNRTGCEGLPKGHPALIVVIVLSVWASIGIVMVAFVAFTVYKFYSTPIIMASGRELMLVLLVGIALCHSLGFSSLASPNGRSCAYQRYGNGIFLAVCYSAILVKTNRIARIFRGNHRPAFITPAPQLVITALLVCVQLVICLIASNFGSPLEVTEYYTELYVFSICRTSGMEYVVSIGYNVLLLLLCTCYAFLTRKLPANFNEAKIVGITMYATCVLWIFFLPLFYGTEPVYQTAVLNLNSCFNATVLLVGIFGHKVYVVWYRPEKNTRLASNPRGRSHLDTSVHVEATMDDRDGIMDLGEHEGVFR